jgi:uncharacterized tellurite resistance protein B-like protein
MGWIYAVVVIVIVVAVIVSVVTQMLESKAQSQSKGSRTDTGSSARVLPDRPQQTQRPTRQRSRESFELRWFGRGTTLEVGGFRLDSPCVYATAGERGGYFNATDPSEILINSPVRRSRGPTPAMGYWPWYSRMEPEQRFEYLAWLASGRDRLPANEGHLFLYFYGIERRLLLDEEDRGWGLQEVVRLRKLDEPRRGTSDGRSFRGYSTGLLWFEVARTPSHFDERSFEKVMQLTERWTPELLSAPLAWLAAKEKPLSASVAKQIASIDPAAQRSVVTKRLPEEFDELFRTRYMDAFDGEGISLKVSKRPTWHTYRPASGGINEMRVQVANPMGIRSQFKKLPEIWNSCIADLRKLSRVSASIDGDSMTVDAWEAMPDELRADVDHPLTQSVTEILSEQTEGPETGDSDTIRSASTIVPAGRFAELVGIERRPKLTAAQSRKVATTLEHTGYGIVPDARLSQIRYGWDDLVAVVPGLDDDAVESTRYNAASCVLRLGLSIALADGEADELELRMLTDHIDAVFDLSPEEQQRLAALRNLLLTTGSDIRSIASKIEQMLPPDARRKVGRLLVVVAAASNGIDQSERAALRKAFRALDLTPELLEESIAEVAPDADESEVTVRRAGKRSRTGEVIPAQKQGAGGFRLNHAAISSIMSETREVSVMLAEAMGAADAESADSPDPSATAKAEAVETVRVASVVQTPACKGPGGRYEPLFAALIERERWSRGDADDVARSHGLMLDAGIETINDWAFDSLGAPLVEDEGDELFIDRSLLNESA